MIQHYTTTQPTEGCVVIEMIFTENTFVGWGTLKHNNVTC